MRRAGVVLLALATSWFVLPGVGVRAEPAPSQPVYGIAAVRHQHVVRASDGTDIFVETWLPEAVPGGPEPPSRLPVIVSISPYLQEGHAESPWLLQTMVPRGYAYANAHVRGTGASGGCIDLYGAQEADDSARVIEYLGRDAPWSTGEVGGYGISYPGGTVLSVAGRGDPARTSYLKTVVAGAPYHSAHEAQWTFDGVPSFVVSMAHAPSYSAQSIGLIDGSGPTFAPPPLDRIPVRLSCLPHHNLRGLDTSGDHTPWHKHRDNRAWTSSIRAATFIFHGHADRTPVGGSPPSIEVGLFDQLPESTPRFGLFGVFGHSRPPYAFFPEMLVAWFDRWLRGVPGDVDTWPEVMVEGTDGEFSSADGWPATGGPTQSLPLAAGGSTAYLEGSYETTAGRVPGTSAEFSLGPFPEGTSLIGQPVLDLWLRLAVPDAHVAARIEALDASGAPVPEGYTYGLRSARHLAPLSDGRFVQEHGVDPPVGVPVRVPVRFQPTATVVPPGGSLRVTVAGSLIVNPGLSQLGIPEPVFLGPSQVSGVVAPVTILHEGAHASTLRFLSR